MENICNEGYWVEGTRISLDSIVYAFQKGVSPESIVQSFALLTLEQVYGVIAFYLANRTEIDAYLAAEEKDSTLCPNPYKRPISLCVTNLWQLKQPSNK